MQDQACIYIYPGMSASLAESQNMRSIIRFAERKLLNHKKNKRKFYALDVIAAAVNVYEGVTRVINLIEICFTWEFKRRTGAKCTRTSLVKFDVLPECHLWDADAEHILDVDKMK